jgi:chromosome segregation protein
MKLKKLTLQGYKTFASRTDFLFDEGITAVVGPNGSGKSNIADAVRWVLGEQSFSTLRGKRTEDMIFAGSQTRSRAGMAQAVLTLDNADGWLPIDFAEVEIGRRAYRSGENEYLLNGQKVRLKDITELLATSGLAERTYTMIGQGLIDRALSLRADERRALFEEAAGIMHYKTRRAETLRRLTETGHNLERVQDILAEIGPRLSSLRRQATRARNFELVQQELRTLLRIWYGYKWDRALADSKEARLQAQSAEKAWQNSRQALLLLQQQQDETQQQINLAQGRINEYQEQREQLREAWEASRRRGAILLERREAAERRLEEIAREIAALEASQTAAQAELVGAMEDLSAAQAELARAQEKLQVFNQAFGTERLLIERYQKEMAEEDKALQSGRQGLAQAEGQLSQLRERLREFQEEDVSQEAQQEARLAAEINRQTAVLEDAQEQVKTRRETRDALQNQRQALIRELKEQRREAKNQQRELNSQHDRIARLESRVELLDQLRQKEIDPGDRANVLGTLAGLITIPETYQRAIEAALAARLATMVVADSNSLWSLVEALDGRPAAILALDGIQPPPTPQPIEHPGVIGWAAALVEAQGVSEPAVRLLLGRVLLVQDRQTAYELAPSLPQGSLAAGLDGFIVHPGGLLEAPGQSAAESILGRETAWREASEALESQRAGVAAMEVAVEEMQQSIQANQDQVDAWQNEERQISKEETEQFQRLSAAQRQLDRARQQESFITRSRERRESETTRLQERIAGLERMIINGRETLTSHELARVEAESKLAALPVTESQQQQAAIEQTVTAAETIVAGRLAVVDSRRSTLNQLQGQLTRQEGRREELQGQLRSLEADKTTLESEKLHEDIAQLESLLKPTQQQLAEYRKRILTFQKELTALQRTAHEQETRYMQTQVRHTQQESQFEALKERINSDLGLVALRFDEDHAGPMPLPIEDIFEELPKVEELPEGIDKNIQELRGQLQRMGGVNPDAPQEFEETEQRFEFLTQQVADLQETEEQLRAVIRELDDLTSRAFAETVEKVNAVFGETFTQLFGGGSARLVLTEPDDLTISGVDIVARLPNQREQGLALLSGGERSLTASALIFSLLKVSPTPFCVMDEVDAALDEANINRFRDILRELSLNTQFIIITHNRGTVQVANTIYGVSMQPDSASQVISIRPEEYARNGHD